MRKIEEKFIKLREDNKKALIAFITLGDPSIEDTIENINLLEAEGVDIIELGVPYSDPLADGPIIQGSYHRALENGFKIKDIFYTLKKVRKESNIPIVLMMYFNIVFSYGVKKFIDEIKEVGVNGLIIPDLPLEERGDINTYCENIGVSLIPLVAPTSKERIKNIVASSSGFIYCVSVNGTTGERATVDNNIGEYMELVKSSTDIPCCIGFGISSRESVAKVKNYCDGIIIGSAIVKRANESKKELRKFLREIREEL